MSTAETIVWGITLIALVLTIVLTVLLFVRPRRQR